MVVVVKDSTREIDKTVTVIVKIMVCKSVSLSTFTHISDWQIWQVFVADILIFSETT